MACNKCGTNPAFKCLICKEELCNDCMSGKWGTIGFDKLCEICREKSRQETWANSYEMKIEKSRQETWANSYEMKIEKYIK